MDIEQLKSKLQFCNKKNSQLPKISTTQNSNFEIQKGLDGKKKIIRKNQPSMIQEKPNVMNRIHTLGAQIDELSDLFSSSNSVEESKQDFIGQAQTLNKLPFSQGFVMTPSVEDLKQYSEEQLKVVKGFTLSNQHGKIIFHGPVDVRGVDLDKVFMIGFMCFSINHDLSSGFKQPFEVQYFNLKISDDYQANQEKFGEDLKEFARSAGSAQFCYDFKQCILGLYFE